MYPLSVNPLIYPSIYPSIYPLFYPFIYTIFTALRDEENAYKIFQELSSCEFISEGEYSKLHEVLRKCDLYAVAGALRDKAKEMFKYDCT